MVGTLDRLYLYKESKKEKDEKNEALKLSKNRHHFKRIEFHSSLTNKYYYKTNEDGTLGIYEKETNIEVPNNANPSKRQILYQALVDLNGANTLYQCNIN